MVMTSTPLLRERWTSGLTEASITMVWMMSLGKRRLESTGERKRPLLEIQKLFPIDRVWQFGFTQLIMQPTPGSFETVERNSAFLSCWRLHANAPD
jgi:hypothetical protein